MPDNIEVSLQQYFDGKQVEKVILFGSHARHSHTKKSDFDIIIITKTNKRFFDRYRDFLDVYEIVNTSVDMLIYTPEEWEVISKRKSFEKIIKESKILYVL